MGTDFRHHLLTQIEMLRGDISHEELSKRLGDRTERCLAQYVAGKNHLQENEFKLIAKALSMDAQTLAQAWASSLGQRISGTDAVSRMVDQAYRQWRRYSRVADRGVPSSPSPITIIRAKYADRLPRRIPLLWFGSYSRSETRKDTPERFARVYEMLVESVHDNRSHRDIGALRGLSGERARQLMVCAAYTWARSERIDLSDRSVPFKNEAKLVRNLYAGLRFFAQQQFNVIAAQALTREPISKEGQMQ
jgi:hypothetical protein